MSRYAFLVDQYATERLKTLSVWAQVPAALFEVRAEPRARTPREQMVHQCLSEDAWMTGMLGLPSPQPPLPPTETVPAFVHWYAAASSDRLERLSAVDDAWWEAETTFFDVPRSRAWVFVRRLTHSAHHRGQLQALLRAEGEALFSVYGPTADTGGLAKQGGVVRYAYPDVATLLRTLVDETMDRPVMAPRAADAPAPTERPTL